MSGHNLMQSIVRVNRVLKDKPGGSSLTTSAFELKQALKTYTKGKGQPTLKAEEALRRVGVCGQDDQPCT